jgi:hypothetical protein
MIKIVIYYYLAPRGQYINCINYKVHVLIHLKNKEIDKSMTDSHKEYILKTKKIYQAKFAVEQILFYDKYKKYDLHRFFDNMNKKYFSILDTHEQSAISQLWSEFQAFDSNVKCNYIDEPDMCNYKHYVYRVVDTINCNFPDDILDDIINSLSFVSVNDETLKSTIIDMQEKIDKLEKQKISKL